MSDYEQEPAAEIVETAPDCPTCHAILTLLWEAHEHVMSVAERAMTLGNRWGVLLTEPTDFHPEWQDFAGLVASRTGGFYVDTMWLHHLQEIAEKRQTHRERTAKVLERIKLSVPLGQVLVVVALQGCIASFRVTVRGSSMRAGRATFTLDTRLVRMVLRVPPDLQEDLITISERLYDETRLEYSYAAIIRGLISLGLASIADKVNLAIEFAGARVPRGRKRGEHWKRRDDCDDE